MSKICPLQATIVFLVLAIGRLAFSADAAPEGNAPADRSLNDLVGPLRQQKRLVSLAAMVMVDGKTVDSAADGERKLGSGAPIAIGDRWHLGSITKSITATMVARLVESGQMKFTDTVAQSFPDGPIHDDWKPVTLRQLLTHTAGAPANFSLWVRLKTPALGAECTRERRKAVMDVIAEKPDYPPGEKFAYSNVGFTIAGAMAEKAAGANWEDLVKREVFEPLELAGAGFGPPKSPAKTLPEPRGHHVILGSKVAANDSDDNTPIMAPAGAVHMTLADLCRYGHEHLRGELGAGKLLAAETYKTLHTPELQHYACGWVRQDPTYDIPHTLFWHNGSNTMWYALVAFIPTKNLVVAVASNDGDVAGAESAAWEIVEASAKRFNTASDAEKRKSLPVEALPKKSPFAAIRW
ncbi:MAG TPA: serine hydrolase domain-containing protein, partial [Pirellulales bacterium]|nr:serine hydrolase domain-containing protein [Pirellulales bacterium]